MRSSRVAKRYARALLGLSNDRNQLEAWGAELVQLARVIETPEIAAAFESPEVSMSAKIQALATITDKLGSSFPVRSFTTVVARHGRIPDLPAVADVYGRMLDDLMGRARATLTFARQPGDSDIRRIVDKLEQIAHKQIIPTIKIDDALLGGVVVELEGKTYDGSLTSRLLEAQQRLVG
ncbi:MAG TPA: ATP synthase F1 subunit delta [Candidatus Binataceae bacterium]|nr:ATP synthase F1 subunit delta [Candidatus Binataceae bacterium]